MNSTEIIEELDLLELQINDLLKPYNLSTSDLYKFTTTIFDCETGNKIVIKLRRQVYLLDKLAEKQYSIYDNVIPIQFSRKYDK